MTTSSGKGKKIETNVTTVKAQLRNIIARFPDRKGTFSEDSDGCFYFLDHDGNPVGYHCEGDQDDVVLAQPVCIVGQWIEDFHPELKDDPEFRPYLLRNSLIGSLATNPLPVEVVDFLSGVQAQQDEGLTWNALNLEYATIYQNEEGH